MKLGIMQPYFFPYIGYFQLIKSVDKYIIYDNLNFIKEAWVNRNRVLVKNSGFSLITVPLVSKSSFTKIKDIKIDISKNWKNKITKTLELNYSKAPMFKYVFPLINSMFNFETDSLTKFNSNSIKEICRYLNIRTIIEDDSAKYFSIENEILTSESNKENIDIKIIRVFKICKFEGANIFHNAIGGISLYPRELFLSENIELKFIKTKLFTYKQFDNEFIPDLSIIDVLMFNSIDKINEFLNEFELI
jgi:hypothetical protein